METFKPNTGLNILSWAEEDRPREKLLLKGKAALSDAELIGILIGSGTRSMSAVDLSKLILKEVGNNLNELAKCSVSDLQKFTGIGEAKAITIVRTLKLGRRRSESPYIEQPKVARSEVAYEVIRPERQDHAYVLYWILLLTRATQVNRKCQISSSGISATVADPN